MTASELMQNERARINAELQSAFLVHRACIIAYVYLTYLASNCGCNAFNDRLQFGQ